jgi:hypothetical protein
MDLKIGLSSTVTNTFAEIVKHSKKKFDLNLYFWWVSLEAKHFA